MKLNLIRRAVLVLAVVFALSTVASTYAVVRKELWTANEYQLKKYSTEITEDFVPPTDWLPGQDVNKDVTITNSGDVPVFVKVKIKQTWEAKNKLVNSPVLMMSGVVTQPLPLVFNTPSDDAEYAALISWGKDVVLLRSGQSDIASLRLGLPLVNNAQEARGKWLLMDERPDAEGCYTLYYIGVLDGKTATPLLVDGVRLNPKIQGSTLEDHTVWNEAERKWVTTTVENPSYSYQNAHYTMAVTMFTVQATEAALKEMFNSDKVSEQGVISYMEKLSVLGRGVDYSRDDSVREKKLWFDEQDGSMKYTPVSGTENWFMSHLNMLPGESYEDNMEIENRSQKNIKLFMQIVPRNQAKLPDELLELIHMKVYYGSTLIYDGTAKGGEYTGSLRNMHNLISLGTYLPTSKQNIRVQLTLDKDTPMEYGGVLSMIDWKFVTEEIPKDVPKTGDEAQTALYATMLAVSATALTACLVFLFVTRKREREQENA